MKNSILLALLIVVLTFKTSAQPINDNCTAAITLLVPCGSPSNGDVAGATQSDSAVNCSGYKSPIVKDVWYQFTGIAGSTYFITVTPSSAFDAVIDLRMGTCSSQTSVACADNYWEGSTETLAYQAAYTGVYYVRVYPYEDSIPPATTAFTICVTPTAIGIDEHSRDVPFTVFPNPSTGNFKFTLSQTMNDGSLRIYNSLGVKVYEDVFRSKGNFTSEIKLIEPPGVYFVEIKDEQKLYTQKVVIE